MSGSSEDRIPYRFDVDARARELHEEFGSLEPGVETERVAKDGRRVNDPGRLSKQG